MKRRSLFISDVHLGSRHAQTTYLLEFLKKIKRHSHLDALYIVGDFIEGAGKGLRWMRVRPYPHRRPALGG